MYIMRQLPRTLFSVRSRSWDSFPNNKFTDHKVDILGITEALRSLFVEKGECPPVIREVLRNISLYGNPEGKPRSKRDEFTRQLNFQIKRAGEQDCKTLLYEAPREILRKACSRLVEMRLSRHTPIAVEAAAVASGMSPCISPD